ncbi:single-stranded-DNA-specific exonuclease RecJ [Legionella sp. W05-934-2]|uniref:single-stranded-DNA-specific exonuclease RecJ n=1 Tax=Legionella sp. W05-934-2 TaxID=1198649 RepID=UPI003461BF98
MRIKRRQIPTAGMTTVSEHPLLNRIYLARGITQTSMLDNNLKMLISPALLKNIDKAVERLAKAVMTHENILVIGDFDADGATSTSIAISALKLLGAQSVNFLVPNRFEFGYGLSPEIVEHALPLKPSLLVTVDNGISSFEGVDKANEHGIDVVITDHHLSSDQLPNAYAIVNPNQPNCEFPSKAIAGCGVIFYVMMALRRHLANLEWFQSAGIPEPNMAELLDLVALGTVADVVPLDQNNRIMVDQGLQRIRAGRCRPGIKALLKIAGRDIDRIKETDLGYAIAPRLNAAGRLDDMSLGIACLLAGSDEKANQLASQLDELNQTRRQIELTMKEQALDTIQKLSKSMANSGQLPLGLAMYDPEWHQGVIGILAGRIKEKYHRPVVAFARGDEGELKGSARSIHGLNIRDVLADIDREAPDMIIKFGGHAMAAGLSLRAERFEQFKAAFNQVVSQHIDESDCRGLIWTDGELLPEWMTLETAQLLQRSGPWGQQFPEPCFDGVFELLDQRIVGGHHLKMSLSPAGNKSVIDAIAFNVDTRRWPNHHAKTIHIAYKLDINHYQGRSRLQILVDALNLHQQTQPTAIVSEPSVDYVW